MAKNMSRLRCGLTSLLIAAFTVSAPAAAQDWTIPQVPAATHLLDPLLGRWTYVENLGDSQRYTAKGTWTFARSADGFVVFDEFRTNNGSGGTAVLADTFRAYNPKTGAWTFQATIYQGRAIGLRNGEWDAGVTRVQDGQIFDEVTKGDTIGRARFYNIKNNSFSCTLDTSTDGGTTWVKPIQIEAVRAP